MPLVSQARLACRGGEQLTDSMRMFLLGEQGGRPAPGEAGVQRKWFYKGDGGILLGPGAPLAMPAFAEDGSVEPEIACIYLIADDGRRRPPTALTIRWRSAP